MVYQCAHDAFFLSGGILFLPMKQECASPPATELLEFFEKMELDFLNKKPKKLNVDKRSLIFWGAIRSD